MQFVAVLLHGIAISQSPAILQQLGLGFVASDQGEPSCGTKYLLVHGLSGKAKLCLHAGGAAGTYGSQGMPACAHQLTVVCGVDMAPTGVSMHHLIHS